MHDSEPSETQTNTFWFTLSTEELFKNHFLFGMSTTLKENILYVGLILVVTFLAVFPMLFECFFASRRRSLQEAASDSRRERIRSNLKDYSMELTAEMFSSQSDCEPNGELSGTPRRQPPPLIPTPNSPLDDSSVKSKDDTITSHNSFRLLIPQAGQNLQGLDFTRDSLNTLQSLCVCSALKPKSAEVDSVDFTKKGEELSSNSGIICNKFVSDEEIAQQHEPSCCLRSVDTSCCICLEPYKIRDVISWSSNPACSHVFHQDCIINWFMSSTNATNQPILTAISNVMVTPLHDHFERDTENNSGMEVIPAHATNSQPPHHEIEQSAVTVEDFTCPCCRALFI